MDKIEIDTETIKLDQFLKWAAIADSGSFAKLLIKNGEVIVNGEVTTERGKKLKRGDIVEVIDVGKFEIN